MDQKASAKVPWNRNCVTWPDAALAGTAIVSTVRLIQKS